MKRIVRTILIIALLTGLFFTWQVLGPAVSAPADKYFYIHTGDNYEQVLTGLCDQHIIKNKFYFNRLAIQLKYPMQVKPGRYAIEENSSILSLVRMLKAGHQADVRLVINKLRTKEDLAGHIGKMFECDSLQVIRLLTSNDSLKAFSCDTNTVFSLIIPDTYLLKWNGGFSRILQKLKDAQEKFWTKTRLNKAASLSFTPNEIYTLASIVEEESNVAEDKKLIASVYINRYRKNMRLQADPTVKYALRNFAIKRVLFGHLQYQSLYNTYIVNGLPPGPICTPSKQTIDEVLNSPSTDYIYFVARPDFRGQHNFSATYEQHRIFAKEYQQALDTLIRNRSNTK